MVEENELNARKVQFNAEAVGKFKELKEKGVISQGFGDFVRSQFHNAIDGLNAKVLSVDLSQETIKKLTEEAVSKETQKAE